ncbi:hypothetical protein PENSUB_3135 [Penicillium subrubescens]|uniref:Uncharacterized protein n=2 Tax=Penicillium subrubescens TaxID=1316194 RepID=A0A1Q5UFU6_9EURO|nr:hypothetical protein PENSUB_3135 [Penicillium subrubescens]
MLTLLILSLATQALAQRNSTVLIGWQFDGDDRSSWNILWTCLSTILACTWTAMHLQYHGKDNSHIGMNRIGKSFTWIAAVLAPELMSFIAVQEYWEVKLILASCNAAQTAFSSGQKASLLEPVIEITNHNDEEDPKPPKLPKEVSNDGEKEISERPAIEATKPPTHVFRYWKMAQGYYIRMGGFVLQTKDYWVYTVRPANVVLLIEAGVIKPSSLKIGDIKDRDKSDPLSKAFTLLQSAWVTINIIARRAYDLPISPLELSTVAYVACALVTYLAWWDKPKDADTFITLHLPYDRDSDEMPTQFRDADRTDWMHLPPPLIKDNAESNEKDGHWKRAAFVALCNDPVGFWRRIKESHKEIRSQRVHKQMELDSLADNSGSSADNSEETYNDNVRFKEQVTVWEQFTIDMFTFMAALVFCGIHIAA